MRYRKPDLSLLKCRVVNNIDERQLAGQIDARIQNCLQALQMRVFAVDYHISPVYIVIDYRLDASISFKTIESLTDDISLALGQMVKIFRREGNDRMIAISVPRASRSYLGIGDMLTCGEYKQSKASLAIIAGVDELSRNIVFDLAEAPHLLISGTTGSGKTVYLDDIILSILFKYSPTKVELVLADPGADLDVYSGIPHLLFGPVSKRYDVCEAIKYVRNRMNERFERLAKAGSRNIERYNETHKTHMPHIVVILDKYLEYTHEMPIDFEDCINEIARKGRAAGVHLIINAQSARTEVVSSDIKANIPYRIGFSVTDWHESKAIIDRTGAQKLLGNGDMLFLPGFNEIPLHIQAPNVNLDEVKAVVSNIIKYNGKATYVRDLNADREPVDDNIAYVVDVLDSLRHVQSIDVYSIQKMMNVDYAEASDIISFLEDHKAIAEYSSSKGRTVDQMVVSDLLKRYRSELAQSDEDVQS